MEKTAVEWLELYIKGITSLNCDDIIEQAKEMEKKQIINAWDLSRRDTNHPVSGEQYYNTIYKVD